MRGLHEFRVGEDLRHALDVLDRVRLGENRCFKTAGRYAALEDLGAEGCGGLQQSVSAGTDDGFRIEVQATVDKYSAKVHPIDKKRLFSLYLDPAGAIHFGTRDWPASASSPLLVSNK
jgi:hypothetical protein